MEYLGLVKLIIFGLMQVSEGQPYSLILNDTDYLENRKNSMAKCVGDLINSNFPCSTRLTFVCEGEACLRINLNKGCYSTLTRDSEANYWLFPTDVYIIAAQYAREIVSYVSLLKNDPLWNPVAKFVVEIYECTEHELQDIFRFLRKIYVYNVVVVTSNMTEGTNNASLIYTYNPFYRDTCGNHFLNIVDLGQCQDLENKLLFLNKVPKYFEKCTFNVAALEEIPHIINPNNKMFHVDGGYLQGLEEYLLSLIASVEKIKFKFHYYKNVTSGFVLPNLTSTGVLSSLRRGKMDLVVGGYFLMENRAALYDYVWGYSYAKVLVIVPAPSDTIWIKILFRGFNTFTWLCIVCTYLVILTLIVLLFNKYLKNRRGMLLALKLADYFYGHTDRILFQIKQMRCFLILWMWYTFLINNFYTTALCSLITSDYKETAYFDPKNLQTIPYKQCIIDESKEFFLYFFDIKLSPKQIPECKTLSLALNTIAEQRDMYTLDIDYSYYLRAYQYFDEDGPQLNYRTFTNVVLNFYVNKGFPLTRKLSHHAFRIFESGLLQYQMQKLCSSRNCQHVYDKMRQQKKFHQLSFKRFKFTFLILFIGYTFAFLTFIIEINKVHS